METLGRRRRGRAPRHRSAGQVDGQLRPARPRCIAGGGKELSEARGKAEPARLGLEAGQGLQCLPVAGGAGKAEAGTGDGVHEMRVGQRHRLACGAGVEAALC